MDGVTVIKTPPPSNHSRNKPLNGFAQPSAYRSKRIPLVTEIPQKPNVQLRFLSAEDLSQVRELCAEIFPIEYPDHWYEDITSNNNFFSLAAVSVGEEGKGELIGMLVAEVKRLSLCNVEDRDILPKYFPANTAVAYILSLGVTKQWRRRGIASLLLDNFLAYLTNGLGTPMGVVKAAYLHVLAENLEAIRFYEKRHFRRHSRLYSYYQIESESRDGFAYVLYVNGGKAPFNALELVYACGSLLLWPFNAVRHCLVRGLCRSLFTLYHRALQ